MLLNRFHRARRQASSARRTFRPLLEVLEGRVTPAYLTLTVTTIDSSNDVAHLVFDGNGAASNSDGKPISLAEALTVVDNKYDPSHLSYYAIDFNIAGPGPFSIDLPTDPDPTTGYLGPILTANANNTQIDGFSQPGAHGGTLTNFLATAGGDTQLMIQLKTRLQVQGTSTGLVIDGLALPGIDVTSAKVSIQRNFIGLDPSGASLGDGGDGVAIHGGTSVRVAGNILSGHAGNGVGIYGGTINSDIESNLIGVGPARGASVGNQSGVYVDSSAANSNNGIGLNVIAYNHAYGVQLDGGSGTAALGNQMFMNGSGGIFVGPAANNNPPTPVLSAASKTLIAGTLSGSPNTRYGLFFYASDGPDPAGKYEGKTPLNFEDYVTTDASGAVTFTIDVAAYGGTFYSKTLPAGFLTATTAYSGCSNAIQGEVLKFKGQPTATVVGQTMQPPVQVEVDDNAGNLLANVAGTVALSLVSQDPAARLAGTALQPLVGGSATFADLGIAQQTAASASCQLTATLGNPIFLFRSQGFTATNPIMTFTWSGQGKTPKWSEAANWVGGTAPHAGQSVNLVFPTHADRVSSVNDLANLTIKGLELDSSYQLAGAAVTLDGAVSDTAGAVLFNLPTTLGGSVDTYTIAQGATFILNGPLSGAGSLVKAGAGILLDAKVPNNFTGTTTLASGTLVVGKSDLGTGPLDLQGGTLILQTGGNLVLNSTVTVEKDTEIDPDGTFKLTGTVTAVAGALTIGGTGQTVLAKALAANSRVTFLGKAELDGDLGAGSQVTVDDAVDGHGKLITAGRLTLGTTLTGSGALVVQGAKSVLVGSKKPAAFSGQITLKAGGVAVTGDNCLGTGTIVLDAPEQSVVAAGTGPAVLANALNLQGGTLVLPSPMTLSGPVSVQLDSEIDPLKLELQGAITGTSDLVLGGHATLVDGSLAAASRLTVVHRGTLELGRVFTGSGSVTLIDPQSSLVSKYASHFAGTITLLDGSVTVAETASPLGTGDLIIGAGSQATLYLAGPGHDFVFDNALTLRGGTLNIPGGQVEAEFSGALTVVQSPLEPFSEIDAQGRLNLLDGIAGSGNLRIGGSATTTDVEGTVAAGLQLTAVGTGVLNLNCTLAQGSQVTVARTAKLQLTRNTSGDGALIVGGVLSSDAANVYSGAITLQGGEIRIGADHALGTGHLIVEAAANPVALDTHGKSFALANPLDLNGGILNIRRGALTFAQTVNVTLATTIDTASAAVLTLQGNLDGSLTLGGSGLTQLGGTLQTHTSLLVVGGTVQRLATFDGTLGTITVNKPGKLI